jgi:hypothetical protein
MRFPGEITHVVLTNYSQYKMLWYPSAATVPQVANVVHFSGFRESPQALSSCRIFFGSGLDPPQSPVFLKTPIKLPAAPPPASRNDPQLIEIHDKNF